MGFQGTSSEVRAEHWGQNDCITQRHFLGGGISRHVGPRQRTVVCDLGEFSLLIFDFSPVRKRPQNYRENAKLWTEKFAYDPVTSLAVMTSLFPKTEFCFDIAQCVSNEVRPDFYCFSN